MILRRVIEHVKAQNWTAVALDFVIVVMGVFIGIQVANLNAAREDRVRERQYVERLSRDFQNIIDRSELALDLWQDVADASERLIGDVAAYDGDEKNLRPMSEIRRDLDLVGSGQIPASPAPTFVEMLSAGEVGLIRSVSLRDALLAYNAQAQYGLESFRILRNRTESSINVLTEYFDIDLPDEARSVYDESYTTTRSVDTERLFTETKALSSFKTIAMAADNHRGLTVIQLDAARAALDALKGAEQ